MRSSSSREHHLLGLDTNATIVSELKTPPSRSLRSANFWPLVKSSRQAVRRPFPLSTLERSLPVLPPLRFVARAMEILWGRPFEGKEGSQVSDFPSLPEIRRLCQVRGNLRIFTALCTPCLKLLDLLRCGTGAVSGRRAADPSEDGSDAV